MFSPPRQSPLRALSFDKSRSKPLFRWCSDSTLLLLLLVIASNVAMVLMMYDRVPAVTRSATLTMSSAKQAIQRKLSRSHEGGERVLGEEGRRATWLHATGDRQMEDEIEPARLQRFRGHGLQGFVQYSSYRLNDSHFVALGLAALAMHDTKEAVDCRWTPLARGSPSIPGRITIKFPGEHHARLYEAIMFFCQLEAPASAQIGGELTMVIDREHIVVYSESASSPELPLDFSSPNSSFSYDLSFCSAPMHSTVEPQRLVEWVEFHKAVHGVQYFYMYDSGAMDDSVLSALQPYMHAKRMDVTDIRPLSKFDTWTYAQVLIVNDCALRARSTSLWALFMDMDEYLHVSLEPPHSLLSFLSSVPEIPWVTFGSVTFALDVCSKVKVQDWQPWAVEQLVFREPETHCKEPTKYPSREICLKWDGHRKYVINPRKIDLLQIHRIMECRGEGLNAHTSLIRLNHYRGLGIRNVETCSQIISLSVPPPKGFVRDLNAARLAASMRQRL